jgi:glycosyltransferase involved in cell wall biosynthesis
METCTIVVVLRDRFSTTERCLESLVRNTSESYDLLVVMGGVPEHLKKKWSARFGDKVRWLFEPKFLNPSEYRNIGLRETRTRLAVLVENDVYVHPGWLEPLIQCQAETGAAMVVPIVLDEEHEIHTAGNSLFVTYRNGKAYGCKELRYGRQSYFDGCNLEREKTDYGELHCQLVVVETARKLGVYDEKLREVAEVDSGLIWSKAGSEMWFEPKSVVYYHFPTRISRAEDISSFLFKWDTRAIVEGYRYFEEKWQLDITEGGKWPEYLVFLNSKLGLFSRMFPNAFGIFLDRAFQGLRTVLAFPVKLMRSFRARILQRGAWGDQ